MTVFRWAAVIFKYRLPDARKKQSCAGHCWVLASQNLLPSPIRTLRSFQRIISLPHSGQHEKRLFTPGTCPPQMVAEGCIEPSLLDPSFTTCHRRGVSMGPSKAAGAQHWGWSGGFLELPALRLLLDLGSSSIPLCELLEDVSRTAAVAD